MSFPADGQPRFVIVETVGLALPQTGGADPKLNSAPESRTVAILDRAVCHREVALFRSEDYGHTRQEAVAKAQRLAAERLAELNA